MGPSAFAFDPLDIVGESVIPNPAPTLKLLDFSLQNPLESDLSNSSGKNDVWTHLSRATYGFIPPRSTTYFTIGSSGGYQSGVSYKCQPANTESNCGGYCAQDANDKYAYFWLWDVRDFLMVKEGSMNSYDVRPYDYGEFILPFDSPQIGGGTYDPESGLLYLTLQRADRLQGTYYNPPIVALDAAGNESGQSLAASARTFGIGSACVEAPALPPPTGNVVNVATDGELQNAVNNLVAGTTIIIGAGTYELSNTLYVRKDDVVIRGETGKCDDVVLLGRGMDNTDDGPVTHGIWTDANNITVADMTIGEVWWHPIFLDPDADSPLIRNVRLVNAGEQFVKASSGGSVGIGVDNGVVEYCVLEYTDTPPTIDHGGGIGYFNGVDVHGGTGWTIRNNRFINMHNPDGTDHPFAPAILMWNGSTDTIVESNLFVNCDRAVALGLIDREPYDHSGGIIRNNFIYYEPGLFSASRQASSDAPILAWDSAGTKILHNTVLVNGNHFNSLQFRFTTTGGAATNNLADASIHTRNGAEYTGSGNSFTAAANLFVSPSEGDLHLQEGAVVAMEPIVSGALQDFDDELRQGLVEVGADMRIRPNDEPIDSDGDGIVDVLEIAMGTDPTRSSSVYVPAFETEGNEISLVYQHSTELNGVTFQLEMSTDLVNWQPVTPDDGNFEETDNDDGTESVHFTPDPSSLIFFRLKVSQ